VCVSELTAASLERVVALRAKLALEVSLVTLSEITRESKVSQVQAILDEVKVVEDELSCDCFRNTRVPYRAI
jgi:hypothetical protein